MPIQAPKIMFLRSVCLPLNFIFLSFRPPKHTSLIQQLVATAQVVIVEIEVFYVVASPGALMYLNEATLLHNIRLRYQRDVIYV